MMTKFILPMMKMPEQDWLKEMELIKMITMMKALLRIAKVAYQV